MTEWQTLLNFPKMPLFLYNVNLFRFASALLSYIYINFFPHSFFCRSFLFFSHMWI